MAKAEGMEFPDEHLIEDYQNMNVEDNRRESQYNAKGIINNRNKDVKDELNVDRMKYAAYLADEDKDPRAQKYFIQNNSVNQMSTIEEQLGLNADATKSVDLPRKSRHTLDYIHLTK